MDNSSSRQTVLPCCGTLGDGRPTSDRTGGATVVEKRWRWYRTRAGGDVVRRALASLPRDAAAAVTEAMKRKRSDRQFAYEDEQIDREIRAIRVFYDGSTYRVLYAPVGKQDQILLALHVIEKRSRRLPAPARRLARRRLHDWTNR